VHLGLRARQAREGIERERPRALGEVARAFEESADRRVVARGLRRSDLDLEAPGDDPRAHAGAEARGGAFERDRARGVEHGRFGHAEIDERGDEHVAGDAALRVEEEELAASGAARKVGPCPRRDVGGVVTVTEAVTVSVTEAVTVIVTVTVTVSVSVTVTVTVSVSVTVTVSVPVSVSVLSHRCPPG
jgi:hypothetical protein